VLAAITPAGRQLAGRATEVVNDRVFRRLPLADHDVADLYRLLKVLRRAEGDFVDGALPS
jgi:hypothetical protein